MCHERVGEDQYHYGEPRRIRDDLRETVDQVRTLYISCDHCGEQEIEIDWRGRIRGLHGPFTTRRDVRRVLSRIPAHRGRTLPV